MVKWAVLPFPIITKLAFMSIPTIVSIFGMINYQADFLKEQSRDFYRPNKIQVFDYIVVGGGSAGAVVANRLSKNSKVLLLEGGGDPAPLSSIPSLAVFMQKLSATDWQYETTSQNNSCLSMKNRRSVWPRGKGLGGTSNLNFMIYQRGNPRDYDELANITGDESWEYKNLQKFFQKSEDYHGNYKLNECHSRGGPLFIGRLAGGRTLADRFVQAGKELGYEEKDLNCNQTQGFSHIDATLKQGLRWSTYDAFLKPILRRRNLKIHRYARVVKVHLDRQKNAYGVTYFRHGLQKFVRADKEIILSAGAIDSPKLLMLSGIGPKAHLNSVGIKCRVNLPVGSNLQDHLTTLMGPFTMNATSILIDRDLHIRAFNDFTRNGAGPLSSLAGVSSVGFVSSSLAENKYWPDIGYFMSNTGVHKSLAKDFTHILGLKEGVLEKYYGPHVGNDANFVLVMLGKPRSVGEVRLASRSVWDKPLINPNYLSHPDDIKIMKEAVKFIVDLYEKTDVYNEIGAKLVSNPLPGCEHHQFKSDEYFECYIRHLTMTIYHPCGTCSMGRKLNDTGAVVDPKFRVLKTRGLRVADTSILRKITNANLNAPAILIGEKAAYLVREHWGLQYTVCDQFSYYFLFIDSKCFYTKLP